MINKKIKSFIISLCLFPIIGFSQIHGTQHDQLILRGATLINSTGAPPIGPVDIVIEKNKITNVQVVGYPGVEINENRRPKLSKNGVEIYFFVFGYIETSFVVLTLFFKSKCL